MKCATAAFIPAIAWRHTQKTIGAVITPERKDDMECPICGRQVERLLALSRTDNKTMICEECGTREALESLPSGALTPQERRKIAVMATGNRWAIENFNDTHG